MVDIQLKSRVSDDELLRASEDKWFEVVNGELVESNMGAAGYLHVIVIDNLYEILTPFTRQNKLGRVQTDGLTFILKRDEEGILKSRIPDVSFIRKGRIPKDYDWSLPFPGAPDLAIEVMSPSNTVEDILERIDDYFEGGTEQVWVIYPTRRELYQYRREAPNTVLIYRSGESLDCTPLFPGLMLSVDSLFVIEED